jgi:selenoprotein W-related protein
MGYRSYCTGGIFDNHVNDTLIWSRKEQGGFPDIKALKQRVRDQINPGQSLGHSDRPSNPDTGAY